MIATTSRQSSSLSEEARTQFANMLPELNRQIAFRFRNLKPELREERSADAVGLALEMFSRLVRRDKTDRAHPTPLATYACRQVRDGRRCGSSLNVCDISSRHCRKRKRIRKNSLSCRNRDSGNWQELVVEDRKAGPADVAAVRINFRDWLKSLPEKKRWVAETLAGGETTKAAARKCGLSTGRISQMRRELLEAWNTFQTTAVPEACLTSR
jgi:hypothetical protein